MCGIQTRTISTFISNSYGSLYKAINTLAPSYLQDLCVTLQLFPPAPPSALQLVETLSSLVPGDVSATVHFACCQPFELLFL